MRLTETVLRTSTRATRVTCVTRVTRARRATRAKLGKLKANLTAKMPPIGHEVDDVKKEHRE